METQEKYEVAVADVETEASALVIPRPEEIDVEVLRSYLTSWKQGGKQVTAQDFTAQLLLKT